MHRERVSENVFWFQSEIYAQVTAGVVAGPQWAVVIDTLALPDETLSIREFIEHELNVPVRYVINTHYHADHAWGGFDTPGHLDRPPRGARCHGWALARHTTEWAIRRHHPG